MPFVVSPVLPFPNIYWWSFAVASPGLLLDDTEHFEKMSLRNRYMVCGADGPLTLSIPLVQGRQQRRPMREVLIDNKTRWQVQHWRTLESVYNRSPYFEFYARDLQTLYTEPFERLVDFSMASIELLGKLSGIKNEVAQAEHYQKRYPDAFADLRGDFRSKDYAEHADRFPVYHQTFDDRHGFLPNLSLLDLLVAAGRTAKDYIPGVQ
jgi:hypothetical protein